MKQMNGKFCDEKEGVHTVLNSDRSRLESVIRDVFPESRNAVARAYEEQRAARNKVPTKCEAEEK